MSNIKNSWFWQMFLFCAIFIIWKENLSVAACVLRLLANCTFLQSSTFPNLTISNHQLFASLPLNANEIVRFLKYVQLLVFFSQKFGFFEIKKSLKSGTSWQIRCRMRIIWYYILKISFFAKI